MIPKETKVQRIIAFMHDLSEHITNSKKFSFTNKSVQHKLNWCTNGHCIRGILIEHNIVYTIGNWKMAFTPAANECKMRDLATRIVDWIDGNKTYLDTITNDVDLNTIDEKPVDYNEIAHLYKESNRNRADSNGHIFPRINNKDIVGPYVDVPCAKCGVIKRRYNNGKTAYKNAAGGITPYNTVLCNGKIEEQPLPATPPVIKELTPTMQPMKEIKAVDENIEARMRECIVIMRVMYEDMITNNVNTNSRFMAGRFLYSQECENIINKIENKKAC